MKSTRAEISTIYSAGLVQGIVLVTFPAADTIFASPSYYGLSTTQYGFMFLPQVATAIIASLLGADWARRYSLKRIYLAGLGADFVSMALLIASQFCSSTRGVAYGLLLVATASLGVGFGLVVPALNRFAAALHPDGVDRAVLVLNALLGLGTALAPLFVAIFVGVGLWWGLPVMSAVLLVALLIVSIRLPLDPSGTRAEPVRAQRKRVMVPPRFWLFAVFAVLYGICETMNGNWSQPLMVHLGATTTQASLTLTAFWVMVTAGRVLFALIQHVFPTSRTYHLLPLVLTTAFVLIALLPKGSTGLGVACFGLAGLGCSALLPLTLSFSQEQLVSMSALVAGAVIACYQLGYGLAAFGAGPLQSAGVSLSTIFGVSTAFAAAMGVLSFVLTRRHHRVSHLHPRPALHAGVGTS
jgi:MFS family permease